MDLQQYLCGLPPDRIIGSLMVPKSVRRIRSSVGRGVGRLKDRTVSTVTSVSSTVGNVTRPKPNYRRHLPVGSGEYSVGCVDIMSDRTVTGTFMRLYYPTTKSDIFERDSQWPLWLPRKQYGHGYVYFRRKNTKIYGTILNWVGGDVYVPVLWQAPVLDNGTKFPVVLYSHGLGGNRTTYTTVCCDIASHGFIVAAIEHRDGSASMTYCFKDPSNNNNGNSSDSDSSEESSGETEGIDAERLLAEDSDYYDYLEHAINNKEKWLLYERQEDELNYELRNKQIHLRVKEIQRMLNFLENINSGKDLRNVLGHKFDMRQLKGMMDLDRVSIVGHSFGGASTVAALVKDKRIKCGVALDSWMLPVDDEIYKMYDGKKPICFVNSDTFQWKDNVNDMLKLGLNEPDQEERLMLTIRGTCHQTATDFQFLVPSKIAKILELRDSLDSNAAMDLTNRAAVGFLCKHLDIPDRKIPEDILSGTHPLVVLGTTVDMTVEDGSCPHKE